MVKKLILALSIFSLFPVQSFADDSIGEPLTAWKSKTISVCWATIEQLPQSMAWHKFTELELKSIKELNKMTTLSDESKKIIEDVVTKEYTLIRVGIEFTGWKDCEKKVKSDVVLYAIDQDPHTIDDQVLVDQLPLGRSSIGKNGTNHPKKGYIKSGAALKPYLFLRRIEEGCPYRITSAELLQMTALHEFGHLLGLRHEHVRKEAKTDPNCLLMGVKAEEAPFKSTRSYWEYDPNSIMSYCYMYVSMYRLGLKFYSFEDKNDALTVPAELTSSLPGVLASKISFKDETLIQKSSLDADGKVILHEQRIGLSMGDLHTLRCMYHFYDPLDEANNCKPTLL